MKKFTIKAKFLGKKVTGSVGVINLTEKTSQKDLNKLYKAGFNNIVEVVESNAKKED